MPALVASRFGGELVLIDGGAGGAAGAAVDDTRRHATRELASLALDDAGDAAVDPRDRASAQVDRVVGAAARR